MPPRRREHRGGQKCLCPSICPHYRRGNNRCTNQKQILPWRHLPLASPQRYSQEEVSHCIPGSSLALKGATAEPWVQWHSREKENGRPLSCQIRVKICRH